MIPLASQFVQAATTALRGIVFLATGAEAAAGVNTSKVITPETLFAGLNATGSAPIYACRAWVNFNGTGTVAIRASGNVSSITDNGVGDFTLNMTTAMPDTNYVFTCLHGGTANAGQTRDASEITARTASAFRFYTLGNTGGFLDSAQVNIMVLR